MLSDWLKIERRLPLLIAGTYVLCLVTACVLTLPTKLHSSQYNYYDDYAASLLHGRLWVNAASGPEGCRHDFSFYEGYCYLYFGVVPAVFHLLLPVVSDRVFSILTSSVGMFFLLKIILLLALRLSGDRPPEPMVLVPLSLFVAFGTGVFATAMCGWVYGEAIAFAYAFGLAGAFTIIRAVIARNHSPFHFLLAGLLLGLASLSRPTWFFASAGLTLYLFLHLVARGDEPRHRSIKLICAFALPTVLAVVLAGWMNWSRFGDPLEVGNTYIATYVMEKRDFRLLPKLSLSFLPYNALTYLFTGLPPRVLWHHDGELVWRRWPVTVWAAHGIYSESPVGLFAVMPSLFLGFLHWHRLPREARRFVLGIVLAISPIALLLLVFDAQIWRYQIEVWLAPILLLLPVLISRSSQMRVWEISVHWFSAFFCAILSAMNTYVIVSGRLHQL